MHRSVFLRVEGSKVNENRTALKMIVVKKMVEQSGIDSINSHLT